MINLFGAKVLAAGSTGPGGAVARQRGGGAAAVLIASFALLCLDTSWARPASPGATDHADEAVPGQSVYMIQCAGCHGEDLEGGFGPALRGDAFRNRWAGMSPDGRIDDIARTMPPANPGGLSQSTYQQLAALILGKNGLESAGRAPDAQTDMSGAAATASGPEPGGVGKDVANEDAVYREALARREAKLAKLTPVDDSVLRNPPPADWLQWRRSDDGHGFSPLDQISAANVDALTVAWTKNLPIGVNQITPLVHDGVMFINSAGTVVALDVNNGDLLWQRRASSDVAMGGLPVSQPKSMAIYGENLYVPTLDNRIIALNIRTGAVVWDHLIQQSEGTLRITAAPIVVHGKVITGLSGCARFIRPRGCSIVALDAQTGEELWRFFTVPQGDEPGADTWNGAPPEKRIGGGVWSTGTYDPSTNLLYIGVGNTYHITALLSPGGKPSSKNAALYTNATLALDPDTGKLVWYYQHMMRELWGFDWGFERTLLDVDYKGAKRRVVATMGKLGILDALDAKTGKYLFSYDVGIQNLVTAIDPRTGRKTTDPAMEPQPNKPVHVCPFDIGARNWPATSYDPRRGLLYVPLGDSCMDYTWNKGAEELDNTFSARPRTDAEGNNGRFAAIDIAGRKAIWTNRYRAPVISSALATAGGIVFEGGRDRQFRALDSGTGRLMWKIHLNSIPSSSPISFSDMGVQYVAVVAGGGNPNDVTRASQTPEIEPVMPGTTLWVFRLRSDQR